jgi:hypothetical protein
LLERKIEAQMTEESSWDRNLQVPMTGAQKIEVWSLVQNFEGQMNEDCLIAVLSLVLSFEEPKTWPMIVEQKTEAHCYVVQNFLLPTTEEQTIEPHLIAALSLVLSFEEPKAWQMIAEQKIEAHCYVVQNSLLLTT